MTYQSDLNESMKLYLKQLKEEYVCYKEVFDYAVRERKAIENLDMRDLRSIVSQKQLLLDEAQKIEKNISELRKLWKEAKDHIDSILSEEIFNFTKEFSDFMKTLLDYEAQNEKLFVEKNHLKQDEVKNIQVGRQANKAYADTKLAEVNANRNFIG